MSDEAFVHARWHRALDDIDAERPGPIRDHIIAHDDRVRSDERMRLGMTEEHDGPHQCLGCGLARAIRPLTAMVARSRSAATYPRPTSAPAPDDAEGKG